MDKVEALGIQYSNVPDSVLCVNDIYILAKPSSLSLCECVGAVLCDVLLAVLMLI